MKKVFIILTLLFFMGYPMLTFAYPSNSMVRVGIMDEKYTTVEKTNITVYSTSEIIMYDIDKQEELATIPGGAELRISKSEGKYNLYYIDPNSEIEMEAKIDSDFILKVNEGVLGIKDLKRGGKPAQYRGEFRIISCPDKTDKFYLINCLDVEQYLKGVVPCEMPVSFGLEALKAQAVAARVYSLTPRTKVSRAYDVVDSVASQVYYGYNRENEISNKAIDSTHGLVALCDDEMIVAVFCSTAGGYTESYSNTFSDPITKQFPSPQRKYLKATPDLPQIKPLNNEEDAFNFYSTKPQSYDMTSPLYRWTKKWTKNELQNVLKTTLLVQSKAGFVEPKLLKSEDFGKLKEIKVTKRGESGKIVTMNIVTDKNTYTIGKELVIRRVFQKDGKALPSANVVFKTINITDKVDNNDFDEIIAYGGGFGHGCGLSQFGAKYMAQECHLPFDIILKHYYNGICIGTKPVELGQKTITQSFYQPFKNATLVIPNKYHLKQLYLSINNQDICVKTDNSQRVEADISEYIKPQELNTVEFKSVDEFETHNIKNPTHLKKIKVYIKVENKS